MQYINRYFLKKFSRNFEPSRRGRTLFFCENFSRVEGLTWWLMMPWPSKKRARDGASGTRLWDKHVRGRKEDSLAFRKESSGNRGAHGSLRLTGWHACLEKNRRGELDLKERKNSRPLRTGTLFQYVQIGHIIWKRFFRWWDDENKMGKYGWQATGKMIL